MLGERIGVLEDELLIDHTQKTLPQMHRLRRELLFLKKTIWPLREVISAMLRSETGLIRQTTQFYIRDLYDHVIQVVDSLEDYRELTSALLEIYLSSVSNRMNEVIKVLTIISTIFIPITFIVGVYGMNFEFMPELKWRWGICAGVGGDDCNDRCHAELFQKKEMVVMGIPGTSCIFLVYYKSTLPGHFPRAGPNTRIAINP